MSVDTEEYESYKQNELLEQKLAAANQKIKLLREALEIADDYMPIYGRCSVTNDHIDKVKHALEATKGE